MDNVEFAPAAAEDLPALRDIYAHYVKSSTATFHIQEPSLELMQAILIPPTDRHYACVVRMDGEIIGYGVLGRFKPREAYDDTAEVTVYLKEGRTGRGLGAEVVRHLEGIAAGRGFHSLLAVISGENLPSIKLFERLGYAKCAHYHEVGRKFGRLLDIVTYEKLLG